MAHSHAHAEAEGEGTYFLDQLFTILVSGGIGLVAVLMYQSGMLGRILVPMFFKPVLFGGLAILALVVIRAIAVWQLAGARRTEAMDAHDAHDAHAGHDHGHAHDTHENCGHDHGHDHGHGPDTDCGHDHGHSHSHSHSHAHSEVAAEDHGHDHGWAPWRYMVLAVPIFLYFLGLPRAGLSEWDKSRMTAGSLQQGPKRQLLAALAGGPALTKVLRNPNPERLPLRFKELAEAAAIPARQEQLEGNIGVLRGQFIPLRGSDREFTLLRVNRTCCAADEVMLQIRIEAPDAIQGINSEQWIQVEGLISFQRTENGKSIPVITLRSNDDIDPNVQATTSMEDF